LKSAIDLCENLPEGHGKPEARALGVSKRRFTGKPDRQHTESEWTFAKKSHSNWTAFQDTVNFDDNKMVHL
jgi:hypothetical protein